MKKVGVVLFIVTLWAGAANAVQSVIGVNFCESAAIDHLAGETADGLSNWTDSTGSNNGTGLVVLGTDDHIICDWTSSNT